MERENKREMQGERNRERTRAEKNREGEHREGERGNTGIERDIYRRRKRKKD